MFIDRLDAAQQLAQKLDFLSTQSDVVVLAVPRGGLPIGAFIAQYLHAPLDVILTKKISAPGAPEFAIGAATPTTFFIDPDYDVPALQAHITHEVAHVQELLQKRAALYHRSQAALTLHNKIVIIVDDGVATGHTILAAIKAVHAHTPKKIIIATPVITPQAVALFQSHGAQVISVIAPQHLQAIGQFYQDFPQVSDEQAVRIMHDFQKSRDSE